MVLAVMSSSMLALQYDSLVNVSGGRWGEDTIPPFNSTEVCLVLTWDVLSSTGMGHPRECYSYRERSGRCGCESQTAVPGTASPARYQEHRHCTKVSSCTAKTSRDSSHSGIRRGVEKLLWPIMLLSQGRVQPCLLRTTCLPSHDRGQCGLVRGEGEVSIGKAVKGKSEGECVRKPAARAFAPSSTACGAATSL